MRKGRFAVLLALILIFSVLASGCLGGGGGGVKEKIKEKASSAIESYSESHASSSSYTESEGETGTGTETSTSAYSTWEEPWDAYHPPVQIDGNMYLITYVKYRLRVRKEEGGPPSTSTRWRRSAGIQRYTSTERR